MHTSPTPKSLQRKHFSDFTLDPETGELCRGGAIVPLRPLATRALVILVGRAGRLTTRDELRQALWAEVCLDWNQALNQCIRQIRKVLGDPADSPIYLETVHHRGYRFIAPVTAGDAAGAIPASPGATRGGDFRLFLAGIGAAVAIAAAWLVTICFTL